MQVKTGKCQKFCGKVTIYVRFVQKTSCIPKTNTIGTEWGLACRMISTASNQNVLEKYFIGGVVMKATRLCSCMAITYIRSSSSLSWKFLTSPPHTLHTVVTKVLAGNSGKICSS